MALMAQGTQTGTVRTARTDIEWREPSVPAMPAELAAYHAELALAKRFFELAREASRFEAENIRTRADAILERLEARIIERRQKGPRQ